MRTVWIVSTVLVCGIPLVIAATPPAPEPAPAPAMVASAPATRQMSLTERAEKAAADIPWFTTAYAIYGRSSEHTKSIAAALSLLMPPDKQPATAPESAWQQPTMQARWEAKEILPLLKHESPKVRTLGLMLLFQLERVDVLPDIAALVDDKAETFPAPVQTSYGVLGAWALGQETDYVPQQTEKKRVCDYAWAMLDEYRWSSAEMSEILQETRGGDGLAKKLLKFAAKRDPTKNTASLRVALARAGASPWDSGSHTYRQEVQDVLWRVADALPMPRRFFVLAEMGSWRDLYISPATMAAMARQVPREARIAAISDERPVKDPDLRDGAGSIYLLDHAVELFKREDADLIFKLAPRFHDHRYALAAAALKPGKAEEYLTSELTRLSEAAYYDERAQLAIGLARLGKESATAAVLDWFFNEVPPRRHGSFGRGSFLEGLLQRDPAGYRAFVERLIRDERLTTLGPPSTIELVRAVNGYLGRELASENELFNGRNFDEVQSEGKGADLPNWHRQLRATVDEWSK